MGTVVSTQRGEFAGYNDLEVTICTCGVLFAMPQRLLEVCREQGRDFYCPNGHCLTFTETEIDRARKERDAAKNRAAREAARREQAEAEARAQKGRATRFKNDRDRDRRRVAHGVCPCCKRSFKQLRRHMLSQHPKFAEEATHS
jgi:hypothetical protein